MKTTIYRIIELSYFQVTVIFLLLVLLDVLDVLILPDNLLTTSTTGFADNDNSEKSEVCFCSPATAAASALNGAITDPTRYRR